MSGQRERSRSRDDDSGPQRFEIGTEKAFRYGHAYRYQRRSIDVGQVYICNKGSQWACANECLVLQLEAGTWTAWDAVVDSNTLRCRQPVFRSNNNITAAGRHQWAINVAASPTGDGSDADWTGSMPAETRWMS